jgi:hypothetical protein
MGRVVLDDKRLFGNHRPEFRPTDSDLLNRLERTIAAVVAEIMDRPVNADPFIYGNQEASSFRMALLNRALTEDMDRLRTAWFDAYQQGTSDAAVLAVAAVNEALTRMRSPVRLQTVGQVRKADAVLDWIVNLDSFSMIDPREPAAVTANFEAGNVLANMAADTEATIGQLLADGFEAQRTWSTGRTTTGLTSKDRARAIYAVLDETTPGFTGADYASRLAEPTRGLFPRWAQAVERRGNDIVYRALRQGRDPAEALRRAEREMERHGARLRRARARMIARTEIARAQNMAIMAQHQDMVGQGVVAQESMMEWITGPFDVCNVCAPLGGTKVPVSVGSFPTPTGTPPAHPNCRCKTRMVPNLSAPPERFGAGTPDDPFRYQFSDGWSAPINPVQ